MRSLGHLQSVVVAGAYSNVHSRYDSVTTEKRNQMQTRMDTESLVYSVRVRSQVIKNVKYKNTKQESS